MTVLLGMTVYLLLIAGYLPETSDEVPLLGIFFIVTIALMTLAIIATIIVLKVHYGRWRPCGDRRRKSKTSEPTVRSAVNPVLEVNDNNLEMISYHSELPAKESKDAGNSGSGDEEEKGRQARAAKLDQIFFWFFLIVVIVSAIAVYSNASRLTSVD